MRTSAKYCREDRRRGAVDVARSVSILLVVVGHVVLAVVDRAPGGGVRGINLLALFPGWGWAGMLSPMPVFFVAAGWASVGSTPLSVGPRLSRLAGLAATVCIVWSLVALTEQVTSHGNGPFTAGARLATQPMWFLAAYVPLAVASPFLVRVAGHPAAAVIPAAAVVAAADLLRFAHGAPRWTGFPVFLPAWAVPWIIGAAWRMDERVRGRREWLTGILMVAVGSALCAVLVWRFGYEATLIDAVPGRRSNSTPPTLFTVAASVAQAGVLMSVAMWLDALAFRWHCLVRSLGRVSLGVYAWHTTAMALCALPVVLGAPFPVRFTTVWWLLRIPWVLGIGLLTAFLVRTTARIVGDGTGRQRAAARVPAPHTSPAPESRRSLCRSVVSAVMIHVGAGVAGLWGPIDGWRAFLMSLCPVIAWFGFRAVPVHK